MNNYGYVKYGDILESLQSLSLVIRDVFGPTCGKVLMKKSTGEVAITNDGSTILQALAVSHPVAKQSKVHSAIAKILYFKFDSLIKQACLKHHKIHGDNSKAFFLMVEAALMYLHKEYSISNQNQCFTIHRYKIINSLVWLSDNLIDSAESHNFILDQIGIVNLNEKEMKSQMTDVIKSFLTGKFSNEARDHLTELIVQILCQSCAHNFKNLQSTVLYYLNNIDELILEHSGLLFSESQLLNGILVSRAITATQHNQLPVLFKGIIINWDDALNPESSYKMDTSNVKDLQKCISYPIFLLLKWIQKIKLFKINLLLYHGKAADAFRALCTENNIYILDCLSHQQITFLSLSFGVQTICDITEVIDSSLTFITNLTTLKYGTDFYTLIQSETFAKIILPQSLILCSPSPGLCSQYKSAVNNAMVVLKHWFTPNAKGNNFKIHCKAILGKGKFNYCFYSVLRNFEQLKGNILPNIPWSEENIAEFTLSREIVSEMLLVIPRTLHNNSWGTKDKNNRFLQHLQKTINCFDNGLTNVDDEHTIEPFNSQIALLSNSIRCVIDVLKIDAVCEFKDFYNIKITTVPKYQLNFNISDILCSVFILNQGTSVKLP